LTTFVKFQ